MDENTVLSESKVLEDLQAQLEVARQQAVDNQDKYLRALAESENMRKRLDRLCEERMWQEKKRLLSHLLELGDQLQTALQYADPDDPVGVGVRVTQEQLQKVLNQEGLQVIESLGQAFDPVIHEAVDVADMGQGNPNEVTLEYRRGYTLDDKLLRPARVQVSRGG